MKKNKEANELIAAVKKHYKQKYSLEQEIRKNSFQPKLDEKLSDASYTKKELKNRKKIIRTHKEEHKKILAKHKKLTEKNLKAKVSGYKYWNKKGMPIKIGADKPNEAFLFNCLAHYFTHNRSYLDLGSDIEIQGPSHSLSSGENYFEFKEDAEGPDYILWGGNGFDKHIFSFHFVYGPSEYEGGINVKALAHGLGGYFVWQDQLFLGRLDFSAMWMNASVDFSQYSPEGTLQVWNGAEKTIFYKNIANFSPRENLITVNSP